jgi:hypothetical protein
VDEVYYYAINEVDIFGITNLVGSATAFSNYGKFVDERFGIDHLTTNLSNRSLESCFIVSTSRIKGPFVFGLDHGFEKM